MPIPLKDAPAEDSFNKSVDVAMTMAALDQVNGRHDGQAVLEQMMDSGMRAEILESTKRAKRNGIVVLGADGKYTRLDAAVNIAEITKEVPPQTSDTGIPLKNEPSFSEQMG